MKFKAAAFTTALAVIFFLAACGTTRSAEEMAARNSARISAEAERTANNYRIIDWKDRSIGEIANPLWLFPAVRGSWDIFRSEWPLSSGKILKIAVARHATLNGAQTIAEVQYAARLAAELKQGILTRAAVSMGSDGEFGVVNDAAVETNVTIAGQERLTDFWQLIETTDSRGNRSSMYHYWVVYAVNTSVWDQLVAKYLLDVAGRIQDSRTQQVVASMYNDINAESKREREISEADWRIELDELQKALQEPPKSSAELRAAFVSDDPAKLAAAGITAADTDYITALAVLAGTQ